MAKETKASFALMIWPDIFTNTIGSTPLWKKLTKWVASKSTGSRVESSGSILQSNICEVAPRNKVGLRRYDWPPSADLAKMAVIEESEAAVTIRSIRPVRPSSSNSEAKAASINSLRDRPSRTSAALLQDEIRPVSSAMNTVATSDDSIKTRSLIS